MRRIILAMAVFASFRLVCLADDAPSAATTQPQTLDLTQKHDAAIRDAKQAYYKAVIAADEKYVAGLNSALKAAMVNQDIDLARSLDDQRKEAVATLRGHRTESIVALGTGQKFSWECAQFPAGFMMPAMAAHGGKIYLFGGETDNNTGDNACTDAIWSYDPGPGKWERKQSNMPYPMCHGVASPIVVDSRMYLCPGFGPTLDQGWGQHSHLLTYDFVADKAEEVAEFPGSHTTWDVTMGSTVLNGELRIYAFAGMNNNGANTVLRYHPETDKFNGTSAAVRTGEQVMACAGDRSGTMVLFGANEDRAAVQEFDAGTETLTRLGDILPENIQNGFRYAWCDGDGKYFVAALDSPTAKAYQFDLHSRKFTPATFGFPTPQLDFANGRMTYDTETGRLYITESFWENNGPVGYLWIGRPEE